MLSNISALRARFIAYGSRATPIATNTDINGPQQGDPASSPKAEQTPQTLSNPMIRFLDLLATLQVPHRFFLHFYVASVLSSAFWGFQLLTRGSAFRTVSGYSTIGDPSKGMTIDQVALTWSMMTFQGFRRLLESLFVTKPSASKMWFVHWFLGIAFYLSFGVALWIEGLPCLFFADSVYNKITWSAPSLKTIISIPIFILASGLQYDCHTYLASLPKYTLPVHPIFQVLVCPHYFAECQIYLSLAIAAAPQGSLCNKTVLSALVFVGTNLAVTASMSKKWYERKFGAETVKDRWKMIPFVY